MIKHSMDENRILRVDFSGEIDFMAIAKWLAEFSEMQNLPPNLYFIYDLQSANLKVDPANLIKVAQRTNEVTQKYEYIRTAFLISGSKLKEYGAMFEFLRSYRKTIRKAYSEYNAAYNWLLEEQQKLYDSYPED